MINRTLYDSLKILASEADDQVNYLSIIFKDIDFSKIEDDFNVDELPSEFINWYIINISELENNIKLCILLNILKDIFDNIISVSSIEFKHIWTIGSLKTDPFWQNIRKKSMAALDQIDKMSA